MYGLKPVPFVQSDSYSAYAGVETPAYQPVPFVQSDSYSAYAGVETPAYQPVPFKTDGQSLCIVVEFAEVLLEGL